MSRSTDLPLCARCGKHIPAQSLLEEQLSAGQGDNNLSVRFDGGYGMFYDNLIEGPYDFHLCHECAHALAEWLGIDVNDWHTHSPGSGQHPDHHRTDNRDPGSQQDNNQDGQ